ncbi:MAG: tyrosine-type recombinase/integrase [Dehalococcoidia bacterium]
MVVVDTERAESGRRKQRWHSGFDTKRDAERALTEILGRLQSGRYVEPHKVTVATFMRAWLEARKAQLRPSTWHGYRKNVEAHVIPRLGSVPIQQLTPQVLNTFYAGLLADGRKDGGGPLSARTVGHIHRVLHRALRDAARWRQVPNNPADHADPPRASNRDMLTWRPAELRAFLDWTREDRLYALWLLSASTGLRRGEVLGLRWRDVDLDAGRAAITQTLLDVGNELTVGAPKTAKGRRLVALDQVTISALRSHRARQLEERLAFGTGYNEAGLVFCQADGAPVRPAWMTRAFRQRVSKAGLPAIRLHDLRHTHATLALAAGVHPKVVSERLGHATVSITLDTYSHSIPALQEQAAEQVAALVFGT